MPQRGYLLFSGIHFDAASVGGQRLEQLEEFKADMERNARCLADPAAAAEHQRNVTEKVLSRQEKTKRLAREARCARIRSALRLVPLFVVALAVWWHSESLVI